MSAAIHDLRDAFESHRERMPSSPPCVSPGRQGRIMAARGLLRGLAVILLAVALRHDDGNRQFSRRKDSQYGERRRTLSKHDARGAPESQVRELWLRYVRSPRSNVQTRDADGDSIRATVNLPALSLEQDHDESVEDRGPLCLHRQRREEPDGPGADRLDHGDVSIPCPPVATALRRDGGGSALAIGEMAYCPVEQAQPHSSPCYRKTLRVVLVCSNRRIARQCSPSPTCLPEWCSAQESPGS